jgi:uncharacterized protein
MPPRFGARPPRRSHTGAIVAGVLAGVFLFVAGTIGAVAVAVTKSSASGDYTSPSDSKSPSNSRSGTSTNRTPNGPHPVVALGDHPFYAPNNAAVRTSCKLPPFSTSVAGQDAFYQAALPCLMEAWKQSLQASNLPAETPKVVTTGTDINTPCGVRHWNETAMYCGGNHTIYMTARYYAETEKQTQAGAYLGQFAHEFGHSVQGMTGIIEAKSDALYDAGGADTTRGLEITRRNELQATCFEGMALAALQNGGVSNNYIFAALDDSRRRGDEYNKQRDHGSMATNKVWVEQGFYKNRASQCNTWSAPASAVN